MKPLSLPGTLDALGPVGRYVMEAAAEAGIAKSGAYQLRLAVDEIVTNIIVHGYEEAGRTGNVDVRADIDDRALTVTVEDTAVPYDPRLAEAPTDLDKPLEERQIGGLGVYLAIKGVSEFRYENVGGRNRNIFVVLRDSSKKALPAERS